MSVPGVAERSGATSCVAVKSAVDSVEAAGVASVGAADCCGVSLLQAVQARDSNRTTEKVLIVIEKYLKMVEKV